MPSNSTLRKVPVTRKDGVATHVWKKDDTEHDAKTAQRIGRSAPPVAQSRSRGSALDMALDFDPNDIEPLPEPDWWDEFSRSSQDQDAGFESTPELLDIVPSPVGDLAVVWQPSSLDDTDYTVYSSGHAVSAIYYKSVETGEVVGSIKMSSVSDDSFERAFGSDEYAPWRYQGATSMRGVRYRGLEFDGFVHKNHTDITPMDPADKVAIRRSIWKNAQADFSASLYSSSRVSEEDIPDDATVRKDLRRYEKIITKSIQQDRAYFDPKTPYIDLSVVDYELQGKGLGTALYLYAAKKLGTEDSVLRGSGIQSGQAKELWDRMISKMPENVTTVKLPWDGGTRTYVALDFRD